MAQYKVGKKHSNCFNKNAHHFFYIPDFDVSLFKSSSAFSLVKTEGDNKHYQ